MILFCRCALIVGLAHEPEGQSVVWWRLLLGLVCNSGCTPVWCMLLLDSLLPVL